MEGTPVFNPWRNIPDKTKQKIVDEVLGRAARSLEHRGSKALADRLRKWRSQTPFIEDVMGALGDATEQFESGRPDGDGLGRCFGPESPAWADTVVLQDVVQQLLLPRLDGVHVNQAVVRGFQSEAAAGLTADQIRAAYTEIIMSVRSILFAHPQLREVNSLLLRYVAVSAVARTNPDTQNQRTLPYATHQPTPGVGAGPRTGWQRPPVIYLVRGTGRTPGSSDLLTPRLSGAPALSTVLEKSVGAEVAKKVAQVSDAIVASIAAGRFAEQLALADALREIDESRFDEESLYLKAEGTRIGADFEEAAGTVQNLRNQAGELYLAALEAAPDSTRSVRGYGRVLEVLGETGRALEWYQRARARALDDQASSDSASPDASHEVLRSTRHYAACLGGIILADPTSRLATEDGRVELRGITAESERLHRELLPKFDAPAKWLLIEWFMGSVLISRGYAAAGDSYRAQAALVRALDARVQMLAGSTQADAIFRGNVRWWCSGARHLRGWDSVFDRQVDEIQAAAESGDGTQLWVGIDEVLRAGNRPWRVGTRGIV